MKASSTRVVRATGLRGSGELRGNDPVISAVLRWGALLAAAIILLGVILYVVEAGSHVILFSPPGVPSGAETNPTSLRVVLDQLSPSRPAAVTDLGLFLLIVTPLVSVAICLAEFAVDRDWLYVGLAAFVLTMLIIGFPLGRI